MPTDKPRPVANDLQGQNQITPAANPYYLFEYQRPAETEVQRFSGETPLSKLADSLSSIDSSLVQTIPAAYKQYTKQEEAANLADFQANRDKWSAAVRQGTVPLGANPHAARAVHRLMLSELGDEYLSQATQAFQNPAEGPDGDLARAARESSNPQAMRQFLADQQSKFSTANLKNGEKDLYNPLDVQEAYLPKISQSNAALMREHANYRVSEVERELKDTVGATISKAVDQTFEGFTPSMSDEERKQKYQDVSKKIGDVLFNKDHGVMLTGINRKETWDTVVDTIIARALANPDKGRDILDTIDHVNPPDGPALKHIPDVQRKRLQAEEHLTSLEIQQENHQWALEQRPYQRAALERQPEEQRRQDEAYQREREKWAEHAGDKNDDRIYKTLLGRMYQGMDDPDSKRGVQIINEVLRDAKQQVPDRVEALNQLLHVTHQRKVHVEDDPNTVARIYLQMGKNPLGFDENQLAKEVAAGNLSVNTMRGIFDDLDRKRANASHPFMRQPEIHEMIGQVSRGAMQNPADEFSAEGQMRASEAVGAFRDKAAAWIAKNPQGSMPEFTDYMRDQIGPILERTNKDYGFQVDTEAQGQEIRGRKIVGDTQRQAGVLEKHREQMAPLLEAEQQRQAKQQEARQAAEQGKAAEEQRRLDEVIHFNQSFKPTGKVSKETGRQFLADDKGNVESEGLITIKDIPEINNGGITNIPTILKGKKYPDSQAIEIMRKTKGIDPETGKPLKRYYSVTDAQIAAREREARTRREYLEQVKSSK